MDARRAIVLLSGGLDSAIMASYLLDVSVHVECALFINRNQSNLKKELLSAHWVSRKLDIPLVEAGFRLNGLERVLSKESRSRLGIPGRNLILTSLALPYAAALNTNIVALGSVSGDVMPDSKPQFREGVSDMARNILAMDIEIAAPLADWENWSKAEAIRYAFGEGHSELFELTWSCWSRGNTPCAICGACESRALAFEDAGIEDPLTEGLSYV